MRVGDDSPFSSRGIEELNGHLLYSIADVEYAAADACLSKLGVATLITEGIATVRREGWHRLDAVYDVADSRLVARWERDAGLATYGEAVADALTQKNNGKKGEVSVEEWREFASHASLHTARDRARELGIEITWDCDHARTPEGYYQVSGGIPYAIAKSLAAAPFADLLWMETKTADLEDARQFADAIHAEYPDQMLAYNLSPSFTGTRRA